MLLRTASLFMLGKTKICSLFSLTRILETTWDEHSWWKPNPVDYAHSQNSIFRLLNAFHSMCFTNRCFWASITSPFFTYSHLGRAGCRAALHSCLEKEANTISIWNGSGNLECNCSGWNLTRTEANTQILTVPGALQLLGVCRILISRIIIQVRTSHGATAWALHDGTISSLILLSPPFLKK